MRCVMGEVGLCSRRRNAGWVGFMDLSHMGASVMLDLIWDVWQQHRIGELEQKSQASGAQVADVQERVRGTGQNLERLMLTSAAMWSLIKERTGLTDQDLVARVRKME